MRSIKIAVCLLFLGALGMVALEAFGQTNQKNDGKATANPFAGSWTYRSFRNDPQPVGDDPSKLEKLLFAEGELVAESTTDGTFKGELRFDANSVMDLRGKVTPSHGGSPARVHIVGKGRPNTPTQDYFYDYDGVIAYKWPNGVNQVPAIVGSVIRVKPHGGSPAGYTASFIAVKRD